MIAEMPLAGCLPQTTRDRRAIVGARATFVRRCGLPSSDRQPLGAVALVSGVGFWDVAHGQTGAARNYAELHPVTPGFASSPAARSRVPPVSGDACEAGNCRSVSTQL
jgi:hypothetical protein